jgi:hypothetical protein
MLPNKPRVSNTKKGESRRCSSTERPRADRLVEVEPSIGLVLSPLPNDYLDSAARRRKRCQRLLAILAKGNNPIPVPSHRENLRDAHLRFSKKPLNLPGHFGSSVGHMRGSG